MRLFIIPLKKIYICTKLYFMQHTYQYSWIIPFIPLPVPNLLGAGLLFFPTATKNGKKVL